jgi:hypothetical protein
VSTVLSGRMLVADPGAAAAAHSTSLGVVGSLHQNIQPLHLELRSGKLILQVLHPQWHLRSVHLWGSEGLARL